MPRHTVILVAFIIASSLLNCRGPEGPVGPPGAPGGGGVGSLTDPAIQPKVLYTFPPANTVGPYEYFSEQYNQVQFRFNKIMDRASIHDAVKLSSPNTRVHFDSSFVSSLGDDLWLAYPADSARPFYNFRWRIGETYTLGISSTAKDVNGNTLNPPFSMTFEPEPFFRVVRVSPPPGISDVRRFSTISIAFNNAVDTSTFSRIHITPPIVGHWDYGSGYYYQDSSSVYFTGGPLSYNTTYTIRVDAAARDVDGRTLRQEFASSFTTVAFRVWFTNPSNGTRNVPPRNSIEVDFTSSIDTGTMRSAFSISPNLPGLFFSYSGSSFFYFSPIPQMQPEATYTVTIDSSFRSFDGVNLSARYQFSFTTAPFVVTSTYPFDGQQDVDRQRTVIISCNAYIDSSTVKASFTLKDSNGAAVGVTFSVFDRGDYFTFTPVTLLAPKAWYTGTVSTSLKALGGTPLKSAYTFSIRTGS